MKEFPGKNMFTNVPRSDEEILPELYHQTQNDGQEISNMER
mgnify:CR=1 FL=1